MPVDFTKTGRQQLRVEMIYGERQPAGEYVLGIPAYEANVAEQFDFQVFVRRAPGTTVAEAKAAIQRVVDQYPPERRCSTSRGYKADQTKFVDQMLGLVYACCGWRS